VDETTLSLGDATTQAQAAKDAAAPSTLSYFIRMLFVLALVLAAIYCVYRLMRKLARPKESESSAIKLLASTGLGPGKALHVVALGTKAYLVGATDSSVNLVAEIEDKDYLDRLVLEAETKPKATPERDFGQVLYGLLGARRGGRDRKRGQQGGAGDFLAGQRDRLRKF
jgi:flagellar protein FliO/FliZ